MKTARRARGAALPIVLLISSMMLITSAAWFETSLAAARAATNLRDALQAFHAADSALTLCARAVAAGTARVISAVAAEPTTWKLEPAFAAGAFAPFASWSGSVAAPQCLAEAWRLSARPEVNAYLLTARGFGRTRESQAWVQLELVVDGDKIEQHWRRVAARPF
ncbi:Tfp pilus assembly protein PilX [Paraburkholderia sp. GAS41]|jgi:Tfp pilus assembly protein PilX